MAIEFPCSQCGRPLKVPEEAAGKQAQCPMCSGLTVVPRIAGRQPTVASTEPDAAGAGGTFNPYAAPAAPAPEWSYQNYSGRRQVAAAKVSGPAIALIVLAVLGMISCIIYIGLLLLGVGVLAMEPKGHPPDGLEELVLHVGFQVVGSIIGLAVSVLILFGAIKMYRLESQGWGTTAAILAIIPCTSPCCLLGLPFGIWALVAMRDPLVKSAFGRPVQSQASFR